MKWLFAAAVLVLLPAAWLAWQMPHPRTQERLPRLITGTTPAPMLRVGASTMPHETAEK